MGKDRGYPWLDCEIDWRRVQIQRLVRLRDDLYGAPARITRNQNIRQAATVSQPAGRRRDQVKTSA